MIVESLGLIILGLVVLVVGGETLLRGAVGIANLARLTPAIIGLTVVAIGTSIPELAVSVVAAAQQKVDITVGNVVGSNIFNIAFVLGISALVRPLVLTGNTIRLEYPVLAIVTLLCVAVCQHQEVNRLDAITFVAIYIGFTAYLVILVREQMSRSESSQFAAEAKDISESSPKPKIWVCLLFLAIGVGCLTLGAHFTVNGAVKIGRIFGMSERLIGLTIVAIGTGLPEVVTSIVSCIRGRDDVAIGNIIGSNLFNILGVMGITGLISPLPINAEIVQSDRWWMLGITLLLLPIMRSRMRIGRIEGGILLASYGVYMWMLLRTIKS
ncbi:MAG: calcium/sodium antiporter [Zavarzinella sp.]